MIASLDISTGSALNAGSGAVIMSDDIDASAVGMVDFASLVGMFTPVSMPIEAPRETEPAVKAQLQPATVGNAPPPTGNSLPGLPISHGLGLPARSAPEIPEPDATLPTGPMQTASTRPVRPNLASAETATGEAGGLTGERHIPVPTPPPTERFEAIRRVMSPELRAVIDRAASVMVQQPGAATEGISGQVATPGVRTKASVGLLHASPGVAAPEGTPVIQLGTAITAAPATGVSTTLGSAPQYIPHDFEAVVERLGEAREAAQTGRASLAIRHEDFGQVSLRLEAAGAGMKFALTSTDPDFAPVAQAALLERAAADRAERTERTERSDRSAQTETGAGSSSGHSAPGDARNEARGRTPVALSNGTGSQFDADEFEHTERLHPSAPMPPLDGALYA